MTRNQRVVAFVVGALAIVVGAQAIVPKEDLAPVAPVPPAMKDVRQLALNGGTLRVGMTSDEFVELVPASAIVREDVSRDPELTGSLFVWKTAQFEGQKFTVFLARMDTEGPYKVIQIEVEVPPNEATSQVEGSPRSAP